MIRVKNAEIESNGDAELEYSVVAEKIAFKRTEDSFADKDEESTPGSKQRYRRQQCFLLMLLTCLALLDILFSNSSSNASKSQ